MNGRVLPSNGARIRPRERRRQASERARNLHQPAVLHQHLRRPCKPVIPLHSRGSRSAWKKLLLRVVLPRTPSQALPRHEIARH